MLMGRKCNNFGLICIGPLEQGLRSLRKKPAGEHLSGSSLWEVIEQGLGQNFSGRSQNGAVGGLRLGEIGR
jgi:hypothetical protein